MSRNTPEDVKRQLRQEAYFGCCKCGNPIIEYHHIVEWSKEEHFRQEDMMVLCPLHHNQATAKAMPEKEQREYKANPFNKKKGYVQGLLEIKQNYCAIDIGTVFMVGEGSGLRINGEDILRIDMGTKNIELSITLYDENDNLLLYVNRNEWISGDYLAWDIEASWQKLTLRHKKKDVRLLIYAKDNPINIKCKLWRNGESITAKREGLYINSINFGIVNLALIGQIISIDTKAKKYEFGPIIEGKQAAMVSKANPRERLEESVKIWKKLQQDNI